MGLSQLAGSKMVVSTYPKEKHDEPFIIQPAFDWHLDRHGIESDLHASRPNPAGPVLGWGTFITLTVLMLIVGFVDEVAGWLGASWTAIVVGFILGFIGMTVFNLPGAILGAVIGIAYVEYRKNKDWTRSLKAAGGYVAGGLGSFIVRFGIAVIMVVIFTIRVL
jgi:hypothetical protein